MKLIEHEKSLTVRAAHLLEVWLHQIPDVTVSLQVEANIGEGYRPDIQAVFMRGEIRWVLLVEVIRSGEPARARDALARMGRVLRDWPEAIPVLIAPYISPATALLCREEGACYLDLAGNGHLSFDGIYIHVEGQQNPLAHSRSLRSLYQPKSERVLRVLLTQGPRQWRLQALAAESGVSLGQVHKVKEGLAAQEWVTEGEQGIWLSRPAALLQALAKEYRPKRHQRTDFFTLDSLDNFEQRLCEACRVRRISCALTAFSAAQRYAPHAASSQVTAFVRDGLDTLRENLEIISVDRGANVTLLTPVDEGVFYDIQERRGLLLATPVQVYLDLQGSGARGQEAAEVLAEREILSSW